MTRFIMTLEEAVQLVLDSVFLARGGEVFVTKMPVLRIADLARVLIEELAPASGRADDRVDIRVIGVKPGEKLYEELLNTEEIRRTVELERYFVVLPAFKSVYDDITYDYPNVIHDVVPRPYNSANEPSMEIEELRIYLRTHGLLSPAKPGDALQIEGRVAFDVSNP
jgi:FlaA1/EpsC-like NDP-sugar epimerase